MLSCCSCGCVSVRPMREKCCWTESAKEYSYTDRMIWQHGFSVWCFCSLKTKKTGEATGQGMFRAAKIEPTISEEGRKEILACQERRNLSESKLNSLYAEMRPAVEEHGTHIEDGGSTATTGTWMKSYREYMMNEFDYYSAIIKNAYCAPKSSRDNMACHGDATKDENTGNDMAGEGKDFEDGA